MCSDLKKLVPVCIVLLVLSILFAIFAFVWLSDFNLKNEDRALGVICCYLVVFVPVLLVINIFLLKKLIEILSVMDTNLSERIAELKKNSK